MKKKGEKYLHDMDVRNRFVVDEVVLKRATGGGAVLLGRLKKRPVTQRWLLQHGVDPKLRRP